MTRTAKLDAPTFSLDQPFPGSKPAFAGEPGRPQAEAASPPAIDNELVSELESALQAVLTHGSEREAADEDGEPEPRGDAARQAEPPADIWYGPGVAAAEPSRPLLLRPAELPEPRPAPAWAIDAPAAENRPGAPRRRGLPLRAALCVAGVLGIVGAGGAGLMLVATPEDEEAPLLAKPVRTETIRAAAAMDPQPESASEDQTAAGTAVAETPASEVTLLRPVGESRAAAIQPPDRLPVMEGGPQADAAEATESVKTPDRLVQAPAPEAPASEGVSGPQETQIRMIPPAAPPADGAVEPLAGGPSAAAGEETVAAVPTPLATEELVARSGVAAETEAAGTAADPAYGTSQPDMQPEADLEASASGGAPVEAQAAASEQTRAAPVTSAVNMRAAPDNDATVLTVVPAGSEVEVIACEYWCEVVFAGERGWIYKSFVRGAES